MIRSLLLLVLPFLTTTLVEARICSSIASGNWNSPLTWDVNDVPAGGDTLNIQAAHTVTIDENLSYPATRMRVNVLGTWQFDGGGAKISMKCASHVYLYSGGSVEPNSNGSSQTIKICGTTYWKASDGPQSGPLVWPNDVLPVELLGFSAEAGHGTVLLKWATASESGSSHFVIERSTDVQSWDNIGTVIAVGNSQFRKDYEYTDRDVSLGLYYYRLRQVDLSGEETEFPTVSVEVRSITDGVTCWPNPLVGRQLTAQPPGGSGKPVLIDPVTGRTLPLQVLRNRGGTATYRVPYLANGTYVLNFGSGASGSTCRFLVTR